MSACLIAGALILRLSAPEFTLSWQHSVEKTEWRESWHVSAAGLTLTEAAIKGSGAGMEAGDGARLQDGFYVWTPAPFTVPELHLAASGATGSGWQICADGSCHMLGGEAAADVALMPCP